MTRLAPLATAFALLLAGCATTPTGGDESITEAELREHIAVLASDRFEGRKPGTPSSSLTTDYIASAWQAAGLQPAGAEGWLQPVPLVDNAVATGILTLSRPRSVTLADADVAVLSAGPQPLAPASLVTATIDATPANLRGKVAVLAFTPQTANAITRAARRFAEAGAAATLVLVPSGQAWTAVKSSPGGRPTSLAAAPRETIIAVNAERWAEARARAGGEPRLSGMFANQGRRYTSPNLIGRIPGTGTSGEAIAIIGHWDHTGICRPEGAPDRICNGAVDNASGIAVMIEVAERLARGPRPARDILFIATTAEESGLLGARHYVANPTVPLSKLVAVLNIDTIAIGPRGLPVSAVNRGNTAIDPLIDEAARMQGRPLDADLDANAFINRQDGAAFTEAGVPAVMAGGSFADMPKLQAFLRSTYHGPDDELTDALPLGGAAEDADLHVILARILADPTRYPTPKRP